MIPVNTFKVSLISLMIIFCLSLNAQAFADSSECPVSTLIANPVYNPYWYFKWDPNSDQDVTPSNPASVMVINGVPPFSWAVEGSGFYLAESDTRANTLSADESACGSATITVTDSDGKIVIGHVKANNGRWEGPYWGCIFNSDSSYIYAGSASAGKYYQRQYANRTWPGDWGQNCDRCPENCAQASAAPNRQCVPCMYPQGVPCAYKWASGWGCFTYIVEYDEWVCN